jgi:hypothetical protein
MVELGKDEDNHTDKPEQILCRAKTSDIWRVAFGVTCHKLQLETVLSRIKVYTTHVGDDKRHLAIAPQLPSAYSTDIYNNFQL